MCLFSKVAQVTALPLRQEECGITAETNQKHEPEFKGTYPLFV